MAEESGGSSWWGTWSSATELLSTVRNKSAEAMTMVKQDLTEFVNTVQHDTSAVVADTANAVKESLKVDEEEEQDGTSARLKQGVSKFLGSLSTSLRDNISQVAIAAAAVTSDGPEPVFDKKQARLLEIQTDPATFCSEPDGHLGMFEEWCKTFDPEEHKGEISELLVNVPEIRALYAKLVPSAVTHVLFWQRYFYRVHQLQQEEKKRAALVARANQADDEDLGWGDEDEDLWDLDEPLVEIQQTSKHDRNKDALPDENPLKSIEKERAKAEKSGEITTDVKEQVNRLGALVEEHGKTVTTFLPRSEKLRGEKSLESVDKERSQKISLRKPDEEPSQRTKQTEPNDQEISNDQPEPASSEPSGTQSESMASGETADDALQTTLHKRDNSSGSGDSSWSKLSDEDLKTDVDKKAVTKEIGAGSGGSSNSSGSGVLVPNVNDKDVDWDDVDDDLDFNEEMSEEEVKRIMESMANKKQTADDGAADLDDDDWENWD